MEGRKLSTLQLTALLFFAVSGGPYGFEEVIGAGGGLLALGGLLVCLLLWSTPLALATGELSCMMPENGGHILWIYRAFGPFYSFVNSTLTFAYCVFDGALYPSLFIDYTTTAISTSSGNPLPAAVSIPLKIVFVASAVLVNLGGAELVGDAATLFGTVVLLPFIAMTIVSIPAVNLDWLQFPGPQKIHWAKLISVLLWNVSGFDAVGSVANEVEDPARSFPIALFATVFLMAVTYGIPSIVGLSWAPFYALWQDGSFVMVALHAGGRILEVMLAIGGSASALGLFVTRLCINSRLLQCISKIHKGPAFFQWQHQGSGTPLAAVSLLAGFTAVLSTTSTFTFLAEAAMVLYATSNILKFGAFIQLRRAEPDAYRPFAIPLGTFAVGCVFLAPIVVCGVVIIASSPRTHFITLICLLASVVGYAFVELTVHQSIATFLQDIIQELYRLMLNVPETLHRGRWKKAPLEEESSDHLEASASETVSQCASDAHIPTVSTVSADPGSATTDERAVLGELNSNTSNATEFLLPKGRLRSV